MHRASCENHQIGKHLLKSNNSTPPTIYDLHRTILLLFFFIKLYITTILTQTVQRSLSLSLSQTKQSQNQTKPKKRQHTATNSTNLTIVLACNLLTFPAFTFFFSTFTFFSTSSPRRVYFTSIFNSTNIPASPFPIPSHSPSFPLGLNCRPPRSIYFSSSMHNICV